jgi:hypothetical protein
LAQSSYASLNGQCIQIVDEDWGPTDWERWRGKATKREGMVGVGHYDYLPRIENRFSMGNL